MLIEAFTHIASNTETYALLFDIIRLPIRECVSRIWEYSNQLCSKTIVSRIMPLFTITYKLKGIAFERIITRDLFTRYTGLWWQHSYSKHAIEEKMQGYVLFKVKSLRLAVFKHRVIQSHQLFNRYLTESAWWNILMLIVTPLCTAIHELPFTAVRVWVKNYPLGYWLVGVGHKMSQNHTTPAENDPALEKHKKHIHILFLYCGIPTVEKGIRF
jgi:hypothetical protein